MPSDVLEKPSTVEDISRENSVFVAPTESTAKSISADPAGETLRPAQQSVPNARERQPISRRLRIEELLREIFEGREEFLGWTPD